MDGGLPVGCPGGKDSIDGGQNPSPGLDGETGEVGMVRPSLMASVREAKSLTSRSLGMIQSLLHWKGSSGGSQHGYHTGSDDLAFRCNLVTLQAQENGLVMEDFSAGHITDKEATQIIADLNKELGSDESNSTLV